MNAAFLPKTRLPLESDLRILTSLRFLAAFWVVLFHFRSQVETGDNYFWDIVNNGARGVDFFFILSGFVIHHVYGEAVRNNRFHFRRYLQKRFSRIYPLHLATMLAMFCLDIARAGGGGNWGERLSDLFFSAALLHSWGLTGGLVLNGPSWTISSEAFAYLMFGLAAIYARRAVLSSWPVLLAFVAAFVAIHFFSTAIGKTAFMHMTWDFGILRIIPLFILGMLLRMGAVYLQPVPAMVLGTAGIVLFLVLAGAKDAAYTLILPFSLLIIGGARLSGRKWAPLNQPLFVYLGEISYSTYMVHSLVLFLYFDLALKLAPNLAHAMGVFGNAFAVIVLVIGASAASYHFIEHPARDFLNNLGGRRDRTKAAATTGK